MQRELFQKSGSYFDRMEYMKKEKLKFHSELKLKLDEEFKKKVENNESIFDK